MAKSIYAIYHINLLKLSEQNLELEGFTQTQPEHYKIELEKVLSRADIPVNKLKKDGELIPLECTKIANRDGVTMLLLNNEKNTIYQEGKDNRTLTYHPGCYIFIDNRKGASTMAIERSSSFESQPDIVRDLLEDAFNNILKDKGMKVEIRARLREAEFWDIVDEQCKTYNDVVRKVSFKFPNPDEVKNIPADTPVKLTKKLIMLGSLTKECGAAKGILHMDSDKDHVIQLKRTQKDLANMVHLCCQTGYDISVHFRHYGLYRFGDKIRAYGMINEADIEEFKTGTTIMGKTCEGTFSIIQWFDEIKNTDNLFTDEEPTPQRRKRKYS